jgi:hypothetical protein
VSEKWWAPRLGPEDIKDLQKALMGIRAGELHGKAFGLSVFWSMRI